MVTILTQAVSEGNDLRLILEVVGAVVAALMGIFGGRQIEKRSKR